MTSYVGKTRIVISILITTVIILSTNIDYVSATLLPPLQRAPASDARIADSLGTTVSGTIKAGKQIQIAADLTNNQDKAQPFAYIVQISDSTGAVVSLSWLSGQLDPSQSMTSSQSWLPMTPGNYTAEIFVWESINNPTALSPSLKLIINVE